ncbi:hypothetical protein [Streptomyces mirabilis]|uniref:hypothetical protein n=1 Tax=Streptomyces mirabilis TaxID=68239 RepID=UPI0036E7D339
MLDEEDEGVGYNGPPSVDTWRSVQNDLTQAARAASPYPWLRRWAKPRLDRLALHVERRRMELAALIDTADLERITALPRDGVGTAAERRTAWTAWRARAADAYLINRPSPDADLWSMDRIVKATPNQSRSDVTSQPAVPRTVGIHLSIPSLGEAQHACWIDVDPLSKGEVAVIAAYKIDADWQTGDVTLAVPRCIAEELLSPTRALDATKVPLC